MNAIGAVWAPAMPPALQAPARDVLRGVSALADRTDELLGARVPRLHGPAQSVVRSALDAVGQFALAAAPERDVLAAARAFVDGSRHDATSARACALSLGFAWDHLCQERLPGRHLMFSESIAVSALRNSCPRRDAEAGLRAASIFAAVTRSGAIGPLPGLRSVTPEELGGDAEILIASTLVWLLAPPAATPEAERRLLEMSFGLIHAMREDILGNRDTMPALGAALHDLAQHL